MQQKQGRAYSHDRRGHQEFRHASRPGNPPLHAMSNRPEHRKHPHFRPHKAHRHNYGHGFHRNDRCETKRITPIQRFSFMIQTIR